MSIRTMARIWETSKQSGTHLLMLLAIADFADDAGNAYPSVPTLAEKCRMRPRNANVILAALRASGELEVRQNEGPKGTNLYRIVLANGLQERAGVGVQRYAGVQERSGLQRLARTPAKPCSKPLQGIADEPSLNHHEPPNAVRSRSKSKVRNTEHPLFEQFYAAYPRKAARPAALKAFSALDPDSNTLKVMLAAIAAQGLAERCAGPDARFVPHPATWIRYRRWEDAATAGAAEADIFAGAL